MRDSLIRWLGGVPKSILEISELTSNSWRDQCQYSRAQNDLLVKTLAELLEEKKNLEMLIFKKFDLITDSVVQEAETLSKPFAMNKRNVMQTMQAMEIDDRVRAKAFVNKES